MFDEPIKQFLRGSMEEANTLMANQTFDGAKPFGMPQGSSVWRRQTNSGDDGKEAVIPQL
jgi:hypothetical protein